MISAFLENFFSQKNKQNFVKSSLKMKTVFLSVFSVSSFQLLKEKPILLRYLSHYSELYILRSIEEDDKYKYLKADENELKGKISG